jgi:hypothetical protein
MNRGHLVQVPLERGVFMPEIDSMTEDLPVDCSPKIVSGILKVRHVLRLAENNDLGKRHVLLLQTKTFKLHHRRNDILDVDAKTTCFAGTTFCLVINR